MPRLKKRKPTNNTYCLRCSCTWVVDGEDGPATVEEMKDADMACPCCEEGRLAHVHAE